MSSKLKLCVSTLLVSSLLVGLTWRPSVAPEATASGAASDSEAPKAVAAFTAVPMDFSIVEASSDSSQESSSESSSEASSSVAAKEVKLTKEEIKEAAHKTPTREEERKEDPEQNSKPLPAPPTIEDTIVPGDSSSSSQSSSSKEESSSESNSSSSEDKPSSSEDSSGSSESGSSSSKDESSSSEQSSSSKPSPFPDNGWYVKDGKKYYNYQGSPVTGWQVIGGRRYQFAKNGALNTRTGIDVSTFQGTINWNKVKADGIDFAMIRIGFRGYGTGKLMKDSRFEENYRGAKAAGMEIGVYFYTQAITREEAVQEAEFVLEILKTHPIDGPVAYDMEGWSNPDDDPRCDDPSITNQDRTNFCLDFARTIQAAGYRPQIYTYYSYAYNKLNMGQISGKYSIWIADYSKGITNFGYNYDVWQYTSSGTVDGISTRVDMNVSFR